MVQKDQGEVKCKGLGKEIDVCPEGKIPSLNRENYEIWNLFQLMLPGLRRTDGYDFMAIQVVWDAHEIEHKRRPGMLAQITKLIDIMETERRARAK